VPAIHPRCKSGAAVFFSTTALPCMSEAFMVHHNLNLSLYITLTIKYNGTGRTDATSYFKSQCSHNSSVLG
jgi:hypothetical protein